MAEQIKEGSYNIYRGKPLVREGQTIVYGDMNDKYVLFIMILNETEVDTGTDGKKYSQPDKVMMQLISTDTTKPVHERMVKQIIKDGLYDAMDIGLDWLEQYNGTKA